MPATKLAIQQMCAAAVGSALVSVPVTHAVTRRLDHRPARHHAAARGAAAPPTCPTGDLSPAVLPIARMATLTARPVTPLQLQTSIVPPLPGAQPSAVPEAATWTALLIGFGATGARLRGSRGGPAAGAATAPRRA